MRSSISISISISVSISISISINISISISISILRAMEGKCVTLVAATVASRATALETSCWSWWRARAHRIGIPIERCANSAMTAAARRAAARLHDSDSTTQLGAGGAGALARRTGWRANGDRRGPGQVVQVVRSLRYRTPTS